MKQKDISVRAVNGQIIIGGTESKLPVAVYSIGDTRVYSGTATQISVPSRDIWIVKVAGRTFKVAL